MARVFGAVKHGQTRVTKTSRGVEVREVYQVIEAQTWIQALAAAPDPTYGTALPVIGDEYPGYEGVFLNSLQPQWVEDADRTWWVEATWGLATGFIPPPSMQDVETVFGVGSEKIDLSINGKQIGSRYFYFARTEPNYIRDEDAQIGTDVQVPTMVMNVRMPIPWTFSRYNLLPLIGAVNVAPMVIDGDNFPARTVMLSGARGRRVLPAGTQAYEVYYEFTAGRKKLPALDAYREDGSQYTDPYIPLGDGYWTKFHGLKRQGGQFALTQEEVAERRPLELIVFPAYPGEALHTLGVT